MFYSLTDLVYSLLKMALYHPFLLILLLITTKLTLTRYRRGLRGLPGPFLASFTSLWKIYIVWREDMPWTSIKLHKKLGPLVRIGPNHVSVAHPTALKVIYGVDGSYNKVFSAPVLIIKDTYSIRVCSIARRKPDMRVTSFPTCSRQMILLSTPESREPRATCIQFRRYWNWSIFSTRV